jgi:hypothetical protein
MPDSRWEVLEGCPVADEALWLQHAEGFASAFVAPPHRERWQELLARRPRRIHGNSHKLHSALDRRACRLVPELPGAIRGDGLFYGFIDLPRVVPAAHAVTAAGGGDAIFSLLPGELAVYFFHEGEVWLCHSVREGRPNQAPQQTARS